MDLPADPVRTRRKRRCAASLDWLFLALLTGVSVGGALREPSAVVVLPRPLAVDLTRADPATLRLLPGIGEARAEALVADRRAHGPIPHLDALTRVPGIGPGIVARLRRTRWVRAVVGTQGD